MSWEPSPPQRKLLFAGTVVLLTGVGIYLTTPELPELFGAGTPDDGAAAPSPPGVTAPFPRDGTVPPASTPSPSGTVPSAVESSARPAYTRTALRFVRAFTDTDRPASAWHEDVAGHSTSDLADGLSYTDAETVPEGAPTGETRVLSTGETGARIAVALDTGNSIVVTVTYAGDGLAVSDVRPEGER